MTEWFMDGKAVMDTYHGSGWKYRTELEPGHDLAPAFNQWAAQAIAEHGRYWLRLPPTGVFGCSDLDWTLTGGGVIEGCGPMGSFIAFRGGNSFFRFIGSRRGYARRANLTIIREDGMGGGSPIEFLPDADGSMPGYVELENLDIKAGIGSYWDYPIFCDCDQNAPGGAYGARCVSIRNCHLFGMRFVGDIRGAVQWEFRNCSLNVPLPGSGAGGIKFSSSTGVVGDFTSFGCLVDDSCQGFGLIHRGPINRQPGSGFVTAI